jgi:hypothetical protein
MRVSETELRPTELSLIVDGRLRAAGRDRERGAHLLELVARVEDDGRKEQVEEERVLESLSNRVQGRRDGQLASRPRLGRWSTGARTSISRIRCPGDSRSTRPTTMPGENNQSSKSVSALMSHPGEAGRRDREVWDG